MNAVEHTRLTLSYVRKQTDTVILFYSGGKDSLVLLDLLSASFTKVYCVFMYFVKDLEHLQPFLTWVNHYPNTELIQYPHWMVSKYLKHNYYAFHRGTKHVNQFKQSDIEEKARQMTGCNWIIYGHKQADSLNRRLMLRGYTLDSINEKAFKAFPLSTWNKAQVKAYIQIKQLIKPVEYGIQNSNGVELNEETLVYLRKNYPNDLTKVLKLFPLAGTILYNYDYRKQNSSPTEIHG